MRMEEAGFAMLFLALFVGLNSISMWMAQFFLRSQYELQDHETRNRISAYLCGTSVFPWELRTTFFGEMLHMDPPDP